MENLRSERTELVSLLDTLKDHRRESHRPAMFDLAIKQTRRNVLGMYARVLNGRKTSPEPVLSLP